MMNILKISEIDVDSYFGKLYNSENELIMTTVKVTIFEVKQEASVKVGVNNYKVEYA